MWKSLRISGLGDGISRVVSEDVELNSPPSYARSLVLATVRLKGT